MAGRGCTVDHGSRLTELPLEGLYTSHCGMCLCHSACRNVSHLSGFCAEHAGRSCVLALWLAWAGSGRQVVRGSFRA